MISAQFVFLPDLNHFLAPAVREEPLEMTFQRGQSIKHLVESVGVPHTEVGEWIANSTSVDANYIPLHGDYIRVAPATALNAPYAGEPLLVLDNHLGRLAAYLRMMGFDAIYRNDFTDESLAQISVEENRILLTRDRRLLMRKQIRNGCCLRSLDSLEQAAQVLRRYDLVEHIRPFRRCLRCNHSLQPVPKKEVLDQLLPLTRQYYDEFHRCQNCCQVYWKGSHYEAMQALVQDLRERK
jgi:uncharacterized protein with PIN domain